MTSKQKKQLMKGFKSMKPSSTPRLPVVRQKNAFDLSKTFSPLIQHVSFSIAEDIRRDACTLLKGAIIKGFGALYFVNDNRNINRPYQLTVKSNRIICCQAESFTKYKALGVCAHTIAVERNRLTEFLSHDSK